MIDFSKVYELKLNNKIIDSIKDTLGNIIYEASQILTKTGIPPFAINSKGEKLINYKMYGNSVQDGTPTPETPIEVESVGTKTINLYDNKEFPFTNNRYINYVNGDYSPSTTNRYKATYNFIEIEPQKTYSINYTAGGDGPGIAFYNENKEFISGIKNGIGFTTPNNAKYLRFTVNIDVDASTVQINEGTTILPFEPYGYRIPVKASNNLYNKRLYPMVNNRYISYLNGVVNGSNSNNYKATADKYIPIKPNTTYSINYTAGGSAPGIAFYNENKEYVGGVKNGIGFTTPDNAKYLKFTVAMSVDDDTIQLNEGPTISTIEEITTNIYLYEPLRKKGEYVDYIDFENKKVIRNMRKIAMNNLSWQKHPTYPYVYSYYNDFLKPNINPFSNIFDSTVYSPNLSIKNMTTDYCIKMNATGHAVYISDSVHTTVDEVKEHMANKNAHMIYVQETPTEETIELPIILTTKGTMILDVDTKIQPSNMEITYKGKEI